ncbi:MAG: ABC transporter permease [Firmicutes bacterium]|nr:ABC transporter permease [Bacillota bacterium]
MMLLAPAIGGNPYTGDILQRLEPPAWSPGGSWVHPLGTDELGRDVLARVVWGGRIAVLVGAVAACVSVVVGVALGLLAASFGRWLDQLLSRLTDLLMAFPFLLFAIGMLSILGPGFWNTVAALSFKGWVEFYRLTRAAVKEQRTKDYVTAAEAIGASPWRIMIRHILLNVIQPITALGTLRIGTMVVLESSLSFLGLGIQPPTPDWGSMIFTGSEYLFDAYWISVFPGLALVLTVLLINIVGENLQLRASRQP